MKIRSIAVAATVTATIVLGLWGVWVLESGYAARGTGDEEFSFQLTDVEGEDGTDILLLCPEKVMDEPGQAFAEWLSLDGIPVDVPGGTMVLARLNEIGVDDSLKPLQRSLVEVLKRYSPRRVVLVAHTFCVYYDTVAAWNDDLAGVRQRQIADLKASVEVLRSWFPRAEVSGYLAEEDGSHKLTFRSVERLTP